MVKGELGGASLKRAIEVLDQVITRLERSCSISTENFELSQETTNSMRGFENLERERVSCLIKCNMDDAEQLKHECIRLLGKRACLCLS